MTDLWEIASTDLDAEARTLRLTSAKVAAAEVWPFLALARSEAEFEHRLALAGGHVTAVVDADLLDEVTASLRQDFRAVTGERRQLDPNDPLDAQRLRQRRAQGDDEPDDDEGDREWDRTHKSSLITASAEAAGSLWDALDEPVTPHQQRLGARDDDEDDEQRGATEDLTDEDYDNTGKRHGSTSADGWHERYRERTPERFDPAGDYADRGEVGPPRQRGTINGADIRDIQKHLPDGNPYKTSGLTYFHAGRGEWVRVAAAEETPGNPDYGQQPPEQGPNTWGPGWAQVAPDPQNRTLDQFDHAQPAAWGDNTPWVEAPMSFSPPENGGATSGWTTPPQRTSARRTAGLTWEPSGDGHMQFGFNPDNGVVHATAYPPEQGQGNGARLHYYPRGDEAPDHPEQSWHATLGDAMQAGNRRHGARHQAAPGGQMGYWNDGQQNPGYFDSESAGLTGDGVDSAPPPITGNPDAGGVASGGPDGSTSAEPIEARSDWYQNMTSTTTGQGSGMGQATGGRRPFGEGFFDPHDASVRSTALAGGDGSNDSPGIMTGPGGVPAGSGPAAPDVPEMSKHDGAQMGMGGAGDASFTPPSSPDTNTPQNGGGGGPGTPGGGGGGTNALDPNNFAASLATQAARRALAAGAPAGGPGGGGAPSGGPAPSPPPTMQPGGPGAEAGPPMDQKGGTGSVPQTSKPRTMPGGGGANTPPQGGGMPGAPAGGGGAQPAPGIPRTSTRRVAEGPNRAVSTPDDPSGLGDEFNEGAFEKAFEQRPRTDKTDRNPNTPQNPSARDPIPTTSGGPGMPGGDDDERREASLVRNAVTRALAGVR